MNVKTIILFIVAGCLIAIILTFLFHRDFRKDVLGGDNQTKLFGILSVSGSVIVVLSLGLIGTMIFILRIPTDTNFTVEPVPDPPNWYAIDRGGRLTQTSVKVGSDIIPLGLSLDNISSNQLFHGDNIFYLESKSDRINVVNDTLIWGAINKERSQGVFTKFLTLQENELPRDFFTTNEFQKIDDSWSDPKIFFNKFKISVFGEKYKTRYTIHDLGKDSLVFDSKGEQEPFEKEGDEGVKRKFHLLESEYSFCLFRIISADPNGNDTSRAPYVRFMGIQIQPEL